MASEGWQGRSEGDIIW